MPRRTALPATITPAAATTAAAPAPPATLGDRLTLARRARFIGRAGECARFDRMLAGQAEPVWFVHGPGGMGKTTLLAELARRAEAQGRIVIEIDARHLVTTPASWHQALRTALAGDGQEAVATPQSQTPGQPPAPVPPPGSVLLVDTFEAVAALEPWLRDEELPRYPADVLVVLAGRAPADAAWRLDPGWSSIAAVTRLAPWSADEARDYVASRLGGQAVPEALLSQGGGMPLLLALLSDAHRRGQALPARSAELATELAADPDLRDALLREMLVRFGRDLADPTLRAALDVLTVARTVTVPLLAETVDARSAPDTYAWLASLPFVQPDTTGLQMHDAVREAFAAAWTARDPDASALAGLKVQQHLARRAPLLGRDEALRQLKDWVFALRYSDTGPYIDHRHVDDHRLVPLLGADDEVLALVQHRLGDRLAQLTQHWLRHRPQDFVLCRHRDGHLAGVALPLELTQIDADTLAADPAMARLWAHVQRERPPRPGGSVRAFRLMLDARHDSLPNPTCTLIGTWQTQRALLDPRADWSLSLHHNTPAMEALFATMTRVNWVHRAPSLDDVVDGRHFGAFVRDHVREPVGPEWRPAPAAATPDAPAPLSADDFAQAVREALRHYGRDEVLASSPLRHARVWQTDSGTRTDSGAEAGAPLDVAALRAALLDAVQALAAHPADLKFHRALRLTWLTPGAKQEAVAAELGLPFNTYRYHLARGAERVAQALWQRELLARRR